MMAPKLLATHSSHPQPRRLHEYPPTIRIYRSVSGNGGSVAAAAAILFPTHINVPFVTHS